MKAIYIKFINFSKEWNLGYAIIIWIFWMLAIFLISRTLIERIPFGVPHSLSTQTEELSIWTNWDGNNYIVIAREGYSNLGEQFFAFFPLYPLLIRIVRFIFGISFPYAGILISRGALLFAIIFFIKLIEQDFSKKIAYRSAWYMLIFPTSFFFFATYTEGLFLFINLATWYFIKTKKYTFAFIFGFLCPLTRLLGIIMSPIIFLEYLRSIKFEFKQIKLPIITSIAPILGLGLYGLYNYYHTQDFFNFLNAQKYWAGYGREGYNNPFVIIADNVVSSFSNFSEEGFLILGYFDLWFTLFALFILIYILIKKVIPFTYVVWGWIFFLIPIVTGSLVSMPRYVLVLFPIFIVLAKLAENQYVDKIYTIISLLLLTNLLYMFIFGIWVA